MEDKTIKLQERFKDLQKDLISNYRNEYAILLNKEDVEIILELFKK